MTKACGKSALARPRQIYAYADAAEAVLKLAARLIEEAGYTDFLRRNSVELLL